MEKDIRFVDLKTGNTFDGSYPYIFWFDGEQSVNLIYTQPICFISKTNEDVSVSIEEDSFFSLVNTNELVAENTESIYGFTYHNINSLKTTAVQSVGTKHHNYYVHMIYILASSDTEGEFISELTINGEVYKVGAEFHASNDELAINLANFGVEIPSMVQKALYDINIHEEKIDDITINRKWKELLSNYWDIIANKGSYKSLINALKWFEYGDKLKMYEVWRNGYSGKYFEQDIKPMLHNSYIDSLNGFAKTTYIALSCALEEHKLEDNKVVLDYEGNPELKQITSKWSIQDLSLKLCMLGNFYETYFMPIHLDLLHSTIEDIVYTSPIKMGIGSVANREDFTYHYEDMNCDVENNSIYRLGLVECYVGPDTMFGSEYDDGVMVGVQKTRPHITKSDTHLRQYLSQLYKEIGSIVDFKFTIPDKDTQIKRETLVFKTWNGSSWVYKNITEQKLLNNELKFSLLCPIEGEYEIRLMLECTNNKVYTKRIKFSVLDTEHTSIGIYRIQNYGTLKDCELGQTCKINEYTKSRRNGTVGIGLQYIPAYTGQPYINKQWVHKGVCLNHLLIYNNCNNENDEYLKQNYFLLKRQTSTGDYLICVSKQYGFHPNLPQELQDNIYRNDYIFVPEFHTLVPLVTDERNINDYKVTDMDALCVIPELSYGKPIEECDWEFINTSTGQIIQLSNIKEPFIAPTQKTFLPNGYYTIVFKYRLTGEDKINKVTLDSAFIKV